MRTLLCVLALAACVPKQVKELQAATASQVSVMGSRQAVLESTLNESEKKLDQVQASLRVIGQDKGDLLQSLDQASTSVRSLRGELETQRFALEDLRQQFDAFIEQQEARQLYDEARLAQVEKALGLNPPPRPAVGTEPMGGGPDTEPGAGEIALELPPTAQGKLDRAIEEMKAGRQGTARTVLEQTLAAHEGSSLIPEVLYRIGETWSNAGNWTKAARSYQVVVDKHGRTEWASWAMLRQGEAFEALGNVDGAKLFYEDVQRLYSKSDAAKEAAEKIKALR